MGSQQQIEQSGKGLKQYVIVLLVLMTCVAMVVVVYETQKIAVQGSLPPITGASTKEQYEIAKFAAEIQQIRSDTSGSLFWLKMIALFVTVGGAVGGYLLGQSQTTKKKLAFEEQKNNEQLAFEKRKNIDLAYQSIVLELSDKSPLLRASAAVKLGALLKSFHSEWTVSTARQEELIHLTKQVLSASLSIEDNEKVLKTLTIALVMHKPSHNPSDEKLLADVRELDLSKAKAADAYWARADFSYTDFYLADLNHASFRNSILQWAQFRQAILCNAVLANSDCDDANFKLADLRDADLSNAKLRRTNFEGAKVYGCKLTGADLAENPEAKVDTSKAGDGSESISITEWLAKWRQTKQEATN